MKNLTLVFAIMFYSFLGLADGKLVQKTDALEMELYKDSSQNAYRYMEPNLQFSEGENYVVFDIKNGEVDFSHVHSVRYFLEAQGGINIKWATFIGEKWCEVAETELPDGFNGYLEMPFSLFSCAGTALDEVTQMKLVVSSSQNVMLDELSFQFFDESTKQQSQSSAIMEAGLEQSEKHYREYINREKGILHKKHQHERGDLFR